MPRARLSPTVTLATDDITQAVLGNDDVARYVRDAGARGRLRGYLGELRTTQRYRIYRALRHPLYPILRRIERIAEQVEHAHTATAAGRVVYVSNHKSHVDYLIEPLVMDNHGIRPPLIAAGINLFGGPLGLLHRHVIAMKRSGAWRPSANFNDLSVFQ